MGNEAAAFKELLLRDGIITGDAELEALTGGVSSDIYKVTDGEKVFVVKRALEKLRVEADWYASLDRNHYEHRYMHEVDRLFRVLCLP